MSGDLQSHYGKAQRETAALLGYDLARLTPEQSMRLDCAVALRLALDDLQGRVVRGESIDVNRMLTAAEALGRLLPPAVLASPPAANRADPRQVMLDIYLGMRRRGEVPDEGWLQHRINTQAAEIERLKAALVAAGGSTTITPSESDITPPSEIGECYVGGPRPGPDDPKRQPPVIEGKAVQPSATAARNVPVLVECVCDPSPEEPWRDFVEPDGSIRATPRGPGRYWGPV